jgi:hypothetical protein
VTKSMPRPVLRRRPKKVSARSGRCTRPQQSMRIAWVQAVGGATRGPHSRDMRLKSAMVSAGPSLQDSDGGERVSAARKPFITRSGSGVACSCNSSSRWCTSSGPSVQEQARSVAAARARWGARGKGSVEGGDAVGRAAKMEERRTILLRKRFVGLLCYAGWGRPCSSVALQVPPSSVMA